MKNIFVYFLLLNFITSPLFFSQTGEETENGFSLNPFKNIRGLNAELNYKGEVFSNLSGGMERKSIYLDNIDIILGLNFDELVKWKGANLNIHISGNHGGDPSEYSGAIQGISNIAAFQTWKLYQFWFEQNLFNEKISLLFGLYDLNSEFDVRETSSIFINPSHGIGAEYALTGENGPSIFPYTSLAFRIKYNLSQSLDIKAAVFDGVPGDLNKPHGTHISLNKEDGILLTGELTYKSETQEFNSDFFKLSVGGWYYTSKFEKLHTDNIHKIQKGNYGVYISAEKFLLSKSENSSQGLAGFLRIGFADNNVNQVNAYYGAGLTYTGLIPGRDEDIIGLAIASISNNPKYINVMAQQDFRVEEFEHIVELTYIFNVTSWLKIQPDIQYVINPALCNCNTYSFAYGTRVELAL